MNRKPTGTVAVTVALPDPNGVRKDRSEPAAGMVARIQRMRCRFFGLGDRGIVTRNESSIHAFVGLNGSGKTFCMVLSVKPELEGKRWECYEEDHAHCDPQYGPDGEFVGFGPEAVHEGFYRVLSTVRLLDPETGALHPRYERFSDWRQMDGLEHAVLVLDEITGVAHSRDGGSLPHDIMNRLMQMRKGDVRIQWSAPAWARADKLIREVTVAVTVCSGFARVRGEGGLWAANRGFCFRTYAMEDFDEWTAGKAEKVAPLLTDYVWGPHSIGFRLYNTKQKVTRLGHSTDTGVCVECGGTRRRPECSCGDYQARRAASRRPVALTA